MQHSERPTQVRVTASLTQDDMFRAQKTYFSKRKKAHQRRVIAAIALMLFPFAMYLFVYEYIRIMRPRGWIDLTAEQVQLVTLVLVLSAVSVTVAGIIYLAARRRESKLRFTRGLEKWASICTYTFSDEIEIKTPSEEAVIEYADIGEVIEDYYGLLLVPVTGAVIYLPTRVLYGDELRFVKSMLSQYKRAEEQ